VSVLLQSVLLQLAARVAGQPADLVRQRPAS
jgi:hypothetical protein